MNSRTIAFAFLAVAACSTPAPPYIPPVGIGDTAQDGGTKPDLAITYPSDFSFASFDLAVKHDFAVAPPADLAPPPAPADLSTPLDLTTDAQGGSNGCDSLSYCYGDCYLEADLFGFTIDEYVNCLGSCDADATNQAIQLADAAIQCAVDYCTGAIGTATPKCTDPNDSSDGCIQCQNDATAGLQYLDCSSSHAVSCNPSVCAQTVTDCHNDGP